MGKKKLVDLRAFFSLGYATDLENSPLAEKAENVYWDGELSKRSGRSQYVAATSIDASATAIRGGIRAYMNSAWYTVLAVDDGSNVQFWQGTGTSFTQIGSFTMTTGLTVEMRTLLNTVICVNGTDKPAIVYYDSGFQMKDLEQYDVRTRGNDDWSAGYYDGSTYTDDTTDAQSASGDDFVVCDGDTGDGIIIAGTATFSKIIFKQLDQFDAGTADIEYYDEDGAWQSLTVTTRPVWTAAKGDKTLEFDWPSDWGRWDGTQDWLANKYAIRVSFTTPPSTSMDCDYLQVYDTHYLTAIMSDERSQLLEVHNNRIHMFAGNNMQVSPGGGAVTGWNAYDVDDFLDGGYRVRGALSFKDTLLVFKDSQTYALYGTTYDDWRKEKIASKGAQSRRGAAVALDTAWWVAEDGIYGFNGEKEVRVSRHIKTDFDSYTKTDVCGVFHKGKVFFAFPTNSVVLVFDPDSLRENKTVEGEYMVSFFKIPSYRVDQFIYFGGEGDNEKLIGISNGTTKELVELENGNAYDSADTTVALDWQSGYWDYGLGANRKLSNRVLIDVEKAGNWTLDMYGNDGGLTTTSTTIAAGTGGGHYRSEHGIPYDLDGYNLSIRLQNDTVNDAKIHSIVFDVRTKRF